MVRKKFLSIFLAILVLPLALWATNMKVMNEQNEEMGPIYPSISTFATNERFSGELPEPPPIPIWDQPPERLLANATMQDLLSERIGNKTFKIPRNFVVGDPNASIITGRKVEFVRENASSKEEIVEPLSHEIIDSDTKQGSKLKLSLALYKDTGEMDPNWDYYAVKCSIEDIYAKNDFWNGPLFADIWLFFPDWCEEVPINHKPEAGFRLAAGSASFGYEGISFSINLPAYSIGYESSTTKYPGWLFCHWSYDGGWGSVAYWYYVFKDYTEAAVGIRVPQGRKPYCYAAGWACWYKFWIFAFTKDSSEMVYWCYVDPPEIQEHPEPPVPPAPSTPSTTPGPSETLTDLSVDAFVFHWTFTDDTYSELKYISIGGMGQNSYGWHAGEYSYVTLFAAVSNEGEPVANVPVNFYLVDPEGYVYDLGEWYTDEWGIAGCTVKFDPSLTAGMYWFIPEYNGVQDTCGFSYIYCLLITGYTYMRCWNKVYIEDVYLAPENEVVSLTANPPEGYIFKYWWINFYYECYENPIYILMDFDCIVLARFDPKGGGSSRCWYLLW